MKRREFITLLVGAGTAWPLAAPAQQAGKLPTIGFVGTDASIWSPWTAAFAQRLRDLGWIEGRTVAIEYRWAEGRPERVAEIAAEFVRLKVDVIVTLGDAVPTLKQATAVIPIIFALKRRDFITLLGGAAAVAWPLAARAQQHERVRRIGVVMGYADSNEHGPA